MKYLKIISLLFLVILFQNSEAQSYSQSVEVVSSGGGETTGGNYSNFSVIGETFVNNCIVNGNYKTAIGFLNDVVCGIITGIDETVLNNEDISIFPNPTSNELFIEMQNIKDVSISIFNSFGQSVFTSRVQSENGSIDISRLRTGIYFVEIKDLKGNVLLSEKIIKE